MRSTAAALEQHIGLGKTDRIVGLEIEWPASKTRQVFTDVRANQRIVVREGKQLSRHRRSVSKTSSGLTCAEALPFCAATFAGRRNSPLAFHLPQYVSDHIPTDSGAVVLDIGD